ncbi:MAG: 3'(2'),5'-bisphosphate nucleotidase CysQ family protein [Candidatus Saccharicenans sp.]
MFTVFSSRFLPELKEIIQRAGDEILKVYGRLEADWHVNFKEDRTPVTEADRVANRIITDGLKRLFPNIPVISEENRQLPYEIRHEFEYCWVLDPLDGTKEFLQRNGEFTVNLALVHKGRPVAGFILVPCRDCFYYAFRGEGAYKVAWGSATAPLEKNDREMKIPEAENNKAQGKVVSAQAIRLRVAEFSLDDPGLAVVASRSHFDEDTRKFIESLNQPRLISRGSSLKFMLLAEGQAHLYPRLGRTMEWDTAAGQAILEEAGGQVLEFYSRRPLTYNKESLVNPPFLATGKVLDK